MKKYYLFVDLESTGLDLDTDDVLEFAAILTDKELNELHSFTSLIRPSDQWLSKMDDYVREMHTTNGLITELVAQWPILPTSGDVARQCVRSLHEWSWDSEFDPDRPVLKDGIAYIGGSSIDNFDLPMMRRTMLNFLSNFHYRTMNVSCLRENLLDTNPSVVHKWREIAGENTAHRALDDARMSIEELKFYRSQ